MGDPQVTMGFNTKYSNGLNPYCLKCIHFLQPLSGSFPPNHLTNPGACYPGDRPRFVAYPAYKWVS